MESKIIKLVLDYIKNHTDYTPDKLFVVWSCYILGNRKFLVGMFNSDRYFEVTYNVHKKEYYIDEYSKVNNVSIKLDEIIKSSETNNTTTNEE